MTTTVTEPRPLIDLSPPAESFFTDLQTGLQKTPPEVPCKYLYDKRGSVLFDKICELDEYYATRTEMTIMRDHADDIVSRLGRDVLLIEYGSGSSLKTRILLDNLESMAGYVPIDISKAQLEQAATELAEEYCGLPVQPVCADYTQSFKIPDDLGGHPVIYFPGSTIGNFNSAEAVNMMKHFADTVGPDGHVLIGVDLKKNEKVLHHAYNDDQGITAAFNKNLLHRMVRELQMDVDVQAFAHRAPYVSDKGYVEMRLVCRAPQQFQLNGDTICFKPGDFIRTERSHKYTIAGFSALAAEAGLDLIETWTDARDYFSIQYYGVKA